MSTWFLRDPARRDLEVSLMQSHTKARLRRCSTGFEWVEDLVSEASLQPYRLLISYPPGFPTGAPKAQVLRPQIVRAPHRFSDNTLCLQASPVPLKTTALLIRNRAVVWFLVYEAWLRTGQWMAPEH